MKKVVVAEASPTIKSVADSLLRQNGYDVVCTSDGLQAWEIISAEKPDLVLIGQGLSGMSGLDLCRQVSGDRLTGGIPVVLMVGGKDVVGKEQILASGARGTLHKPFSPKDLLDVAGRLAGVEIKAESEQVHSEIGAVQTKFKTQVSSTQHLHQKPETYNLEWLDLNETDSIKQISKVASFDLSSDDQGLVIDDDQYGLARPQFEPEEEEKVPEMAPEKDEDYAWFLGEIKKEMGGKNKPEHPIEPQISASPIPASNSLADTIKFDDITTHEHDGIGNIEPLEGSSPLNLKTSAEIKPPASADLAAATPRGMGNLSDNELSLLADRIAIRLAAHLAAKLDKSQIIEAIKAALNK